MNKLLTGINELLTDCATIVDKPFHDVPRSPKFSHIFVPAW